MLYSWPQGCCSIYSVCPESFTALPTLKRPNEITAIPELLKLLEITGCIITIDAMGTQKAIAASIIDQKADYILALKGNQGNLHKAVKQWFEQARTQQFIEHSYYETRKCS